MSLPRLFWCVERDDAPDTEAPLGLFPTPGQADTYSRNLLDVRTYVRALRLIPSPGDTMRPPRHPYDPPHQPYAQHSAADGVALTDGSPCFVWHEDRLVETAVSFFRETNDWTGRPGPVRIVTREGDFRPDQVWATRRKAVEHRVGYLEYATQKEREALAISERQLADCRQWLRDDSSEGLSHAG